MSVLAKCPGDGLTEDEAAAKLAFRRSMGPRAATPTVAMPLCECVNSVWNNVSVLFLYACMCMYWRGTWAQGATGKEAELSPRQPQAVLDVGPTSRVGHG